MGQKINPVVFRTGTFLPWKSRWFSDDAKFKDFLLEDIKIRTALMNKFKLAGIDNVEIERLPKSMVITVSVARPGVVIGRGGSGIEEARRHIIETIRKVRGSAPKDLKVDLQVNEIKQPDLSAHLVAMRIAGELERRMPQRRVVTKSMERVMQAGAKGIKVVLGGRIAGAEIARSEKFHQGSVPTQTLRETIDYAKVPALLKRGYVGVKVWIYKEEK